MMVKLNASMKHKVLQNVFVLEFDFLVLLIYFLNVVVFSEQPALK